MIRVRLHLNMLVMIIIIVSWEKDAYASNTTTTEAFQSVECRKSEDERILVEGCEFVLVGKQRICQIQEYYRDVWNVTHQVLDEYYITGYSLIYSDEYLGLVTVGYEWANWRLIETIHIVNSSFNITGESLRDNHAVLMAVDTMLITQVYKQVQELLKLNQPSMFTLVFGHRERLAEVIQFSDRVLIMEETSIGDDCIIPMLSSLNRNLSLWAPSIMSEKIEKVGTWNRQSGLEISDNIWQFTAFKNKTFIVTLLETDTFTYIVDEDGVKKWTGVCIEMLERLAVDLNFRYKFVHPPDGIWGSVDENGTWLGMVGQVYRGEADFAIGPFTLTAHRDAVIDFTVPYWFDTGVFVMRKTEAVSWLAFLGPFDDLLWAAIALIIPACGLLYGVTSFLAGFISPQTSSVSPPKTFLEHIKITCLFTFGAYFAQGSCWMPRNWSLRWMVICWWFFAIIMCAAYTGNLIAALTVPGSGIRFKSLRDLANQTEYQVGVTYGVALQTDFKLAESGVYHDIWKTSMHKPENLVSDSEHGHEKVRTEKYIYISEESAFKSANTCDLVMGEETFYPSPFGFVFPEKSPYLDLFNARILRMIEDGLILHWRKKHMPVVHCVKEDMTINAAALEDVQGIFLVLLVGTGLSCLSFVVEYSMKHLTNTHSRKKHSLQQLTDVITER